MNSFWKNIQELLKFLIFLNMLTDSEYSKILEIQEIKNPLKSGLIFS